MGHYIDDLCEPCSACGRHRKPRWLDEHGQCKDTPRACGRRAERNRIVKWLRNDMRMNRHAVELAVSIEAGEYDHEIVEHYAHCTDTRCKGCR